MGRPVETETRAPETTTESRPGRVEFPGEIQEEVDVTEPEVQAGGVRSTLMDTAQEPAVRTEATPEQRSETRTEAGGLLDQAQRPSIDTGVRTRLGVLSGVGLRPRGLGRTETRLDTGLRLDTRVDTRQQSRTRVDVDTRVDTRTRPVLIDPNSPSGEESDDPGSFNGGDSDADEASLGTGWLSETIATIATEGRRTTEAPSQEVLEDQPGSALLTGELPTALEVSGDEQTQERIDEVESFFSFGTTGGSR
jgi:hypothetical protein